MKTIILYFCLTFFSLAIHAQVGIGTTSPDVSSMLDITSANSGLLIPRIGLTSSTDVVTIPSPATSVLVYNTGSAGLTPAGYYYWSGTAWVQLATASTTVNNWLITGNTGIVDGVNFIGTAAGTNVDVAFRRNNLEAGKIGLNSTSFGVAALNVGATTNSTAFGTNALRINTADNNVAIGNNALFSNISGVQNIGIGNSAMLVNTGSAGTAIGFEALRNNTSGNNSTAIGYQALRSNTSASNNTAIGFEALRNNTTGTENTAVGFQSSLSNTLGSRNTSLGWTALNSVTTGVNNTGIGHSALGRNRGNNNTAVGYESMFANTGAISNTTAIGFHALFQNSANDNTAVGYNALQGNLGAAGNTAVGSGALNDNSTGTNNTAVGRLAGFAATSSNGTFIGYNAGAYSTGTQNTAVGSNALDASGASARSVAIGFNSLTQNTSSNNTGIGYNTLGTNISGSGNVALGYQAGLLETGSNKLYISNSSSDSTTSLIYGEFAPSRILRTNSTFQIGDPAGTGYVFPLARGTNNQILQTNATGVLTWVSPSTLTVTEVDPKVASTTANAVPKWDGTNLVDGIITDDGVNVNVAGKTITTNFQMTTGAAPNLVLQSDAVGNASWTALPNNTIKPFVNTGLTTGVYTVSLAEYTVRVFNAVSEVRLPDATLNLGKIYIIIGSNTITTKILSTSGGIIYDDVTNTTINVINPNERYMVQSDGADWIVIGR